MSVKSIDLAWIVVKDFKKALKFYTEVVGLQLKELNEQHGWAELQGEDGARLGIGQCHAMNPIQPGQNAVVTFTVEDLEKAKAEMVKKGTICVGDVLEVPGQVKMQSMQDLDGNQFQIVQTL